MCIYIFVYAFISPRGIYISILMVIKIKFSDEPFPRPTCCTILFMNIKYIIIYIGKIGNHISKVNINYIYSLQLLRFEGIMLYILPCTTYNSTI